MKKKILKDPLTGGTTGGYRQKAAEEFAMDAFGAGVTPKGPGKVPIGKASKTTGKVGPSRMAGKKSKTPITLRIARKGG